MYAYDTWSNDLDAKIEKFDIPQNDEEAWVKYPNKRWLYNKLNLYLSLGVEVYPHGVVPEDDFFPCFSKPIYNLWGLSAGAKIIEEWTDDLYMPSHLLMPLYRGIQYSIDIALLKGYPVWMFPMVAGKADGSITSWWTDLELIQPKSLIACTRIIERFFPSWTGVINIEVIDGNVIEVHPRMGGQFVDFYGEGWVDSVIDLYTKDIWNKPGEPRDGISYIDRVTNEFRDCCFHVKDWDKIYEAESKVFGIYLPWHEDVPLKYISDDMNSYRLAVINAPSIEKADEAKKILRSGIGLGKKNEN